MQFRREFTASKQQQHERRAELLLTPSAPDPNTFLLWGTDGKLLEARKHVFNVFE